MLLLALTYALSPTPLDHKSNTSQIKHQTSTHQHRYKSFVKDAILSARLEGAATFTDNNVVVVPVVMDSQTQLGGEDRPDGGRGFQEKEKDEDLMSAPYIGVYIVEC